MTSGCKVRSENEKCKVKGKRWAARSQRGVEDRRGIRRGAARSSMRAGHRMGRHVAGQLLAAAPPAPDYAKLRAESQRLHPQTGHRAQGTPRVPRLAAVRQIRLLPASPVPLIDECTQLMNIVGKSIVTAKANAPRRRERTVERLDFRSLSAFHFAKNLDSVRELKSSFLETVLPGLSATVRTRGLPGEAVRTLGLAADQPPTLALGIARAHRGRLCLGRPRPAAGAGAQPRGRADHPARSGRSRRPLRGQRA